MSHKAFERQLERCRDTNLDSELISPETAGSEELPEYERNFPIERVFRQTNMGRARGSGRRGSQSGRGKDSD